jgi:hypothetical protein
VVLAGLTCCEPLVPTVPDQPLLAVQLVAPVEDQLNVLLDPLVMLVGRTLIVAVVAATLLTVTDTVELVCWFPAPSRARALRA